MGLKHLRFPEETILTAGGSVTVRGLTLPNIMRLVKGHGTPLAAIFAKVMENGAAGVDLEDVQALGTLLLTTAPRCLAEAIALATGEADDESIDIAEMLPADVQILALEKIARLTFATEGGLGNVVEAVIRASTGTSGFMAQLKAPRP